MTATSRTIDLGSVMLKAAVDLDYSTNLVAFTST